LTRPVVAIVGRPNVGKSSLLNRIAGRRVSIVEPTAGVTRDRIAIVVEFGGRSFDLVDTGGLGLVDEDLLKPHIERQIQAALETADVVVFVVDGKEGPVPGDDLVAQRLRRLRDRTILVANKIESHAEEQAVSAWAKLGFGEPLPVSAVEGFGISDLLTTVVERLPEAEDAEGADETPMIRFAVVGKRNSGKSTLINHLAGEERVIVSEIAGTTRDSVDVVFEWGGRRLCAIDTAGLRKKRSIEHAIELFSMMRAKDSIRRADVVVHMFDLNESISQVDRKLAHFYLELARPVLLVANKIDLASAIDLERWDRYVKQQLPGLQFAPVAFLSAKDGTNVAESLEVLFDLHEQSGLQVPTPALNAFLQDARQKLVPRSKGKVPKLFYGTQIGTHPLSIVVFVNDVKLFRGHNYERYLANAFREHFGVEEIPIRFVFRERARRAAGSTPPASGAAPLGGADGSDALFPAEPSADEGEFEGEFAGPFDGEFAEFDGEELETRTDAARAGTPSPGRSAPPRVRDDQLPD
jgi:GTP-binding protein